MGHLLKGINFRLNSMSIDEVTVPYFKSIRSLLLQVVIIGAFYLNYFSKYAIFQSQNIFSNDQVPLLSPQNSRAVQFDEVGNIWYDTRL